jgi:polyphosphate kinase
MPKFDKKKYDDELEKLQIELNQVARWLAHTGKRMIVVFEGRDTAGKGGAIQAISSCLSPRQCKTVALSKPSDVEKTQWYFQRYIQHMPSAGEIVLFDRSWYNRAGVEKVMGFCTPAQSAEFLKQVPVFEKMLADDGIIILKYWLCVDQDEQEERFVERVKNPIKRWKLSPIDIKAREKYDDYTKARDAMLKATHQKFAPWTLVDFNSQKRGRLNLIRHLLDHLPDHKVPPAKFEFPPLGKKPGKEKFTGSFKPIVGHYK